MIKIALTGPECSGKTTLANKLAKELNDLLLPEFARDFLSQKKSYTFEDLDTIAAGQRQLELEAEQKGHKIIVCDTDLLVVKIWSEVKFGKVSSLVEHLYQTATYDLTFLCKPIYDWEYDPLREAPDPLERMRLYSLYLDALEKEGRKFVYLAEGKSKRR
jgi:NadR type nicotinamide-nucleotide adenylyltransferase